MPVVNEANVGRSQVMKKQVTTIRRQTQPVKERKESKQTWQAYWLVMCLETG